MVTSYTETFHAGEYLVSEGNGQYSRDAITIAAGAQLVAGTVLGQVILGTETSAAGTNTGNGTMGTVTVGGAAIPGVYTLKITKAATNAGDFEVTDPNGEICGVGTVGVAFTGGGLSFTLADGAVDWVIGDTWLLTVAAGSGKYKQVNAAATDGTQFAAAILFDTAYAAAADVAGTAHTRHCEVNSLAITWPVGASNPQIASWTAQLAKHGIIVRS